MYHAIPWRRRRLRRLYREFVSRGTACSTSARTPETARAFASIGCRVVESYRFASDSWLSGDALLEKLREPAAQRRSGDVHARLKNE